MAKIELRVRISNRVLMIFINNTLSLWYIVSEKNHQRSVQNECVQHLSQRLRVFCLDFFMFEKKNYTLRNTNSFFLEERIKKVARFSFPTSINCELYFQSSETRARITNRNDRANSHHRVCIYAIFPPRISFRFVARVSREPRGCVAALARAATHLGRATRRVREKDAFIRDANLLAWKNRPFSMHLRGYASARKGIADRLSLSLSLCLSHMIFRCKWL